MAKLQKVGEAIVITSKVKAEDIYRVEKFKPEALELRKEKEVVFKVNMCYGASVSNYGVCFANENAEGYAQMTFMTDLETKEEVTEEYGVVIANLNKVEAKIEAALTKVTKLFDSVSDSIEVE